MTTALLPAMEKLLAVRRMCLALDEQLFLEVDALTEPGDAECRTPRGVPIRTGSGCKRPGSVNASGFSITTNRGGDGRPSARTDGVAPGKES